MNRFVEQLHFEERKIFYITQASIRPPEFVVFTDGTGRCISRTSGISSTRFAASSVLRARRFC
jgi:hypothetical protein